MLILKILIIAVCVLGAMALLCAMLHAAHSNDFIKGVDDYEGE